MNRVGHRGARRERVAGLVPAHGPATVRADLRARGDDARAARVRAAKRARLATMLELAWDGDWYRRAYFDDGTPARLGAERRVPDRLDLAVLGRALRRGARGPRRARDGRGAHAPGAAATQARAAARRRPSTSRRSIPATSRAIRPGVRENGGQYTHAAIWTVMAVARLGNGDEAIELFHMLNPINHTRTAADVERYKVEPYVMAADVYAHPAHIGRGGWTWYTGSAAWMYRAGPRVHPGAAAAWRHVRGRSLHPGGVAGLLHHVDDRAHALRDHGLQSAALLPGRRARIAGWGGVRRDRHSTAGRRRHAPSGDRPGREARGPDPIPAQEHGARVVASAH